MPRQKPPRQVRDFHRVADLVIREIDQIKSHTCVEPHGQAGGAFHCARWRNPERRPPAQAGARVEGLIKDAHASANVFSAATAGTIK